MADREKSKNKLGHVRPKKYNKFLSNIHRRHVSKKSKLLQNVLQTELPESNTAASQRPNSPSLQMQNQSNDLYEEAEQMENEMEPDVVSTQPNSQPLLPVVQHQSNDLDKKDDEMQDDMAQVISESNNAKSDCQNTGNPIKTDDVSDSLNYSDMISELLDMNPSEDGYLSEEGDCFISEDKWQEMFIKDTLDDNDIPWSEDTHTESDDEIHNQNPIYEGHRMTVHCSMILILLYVISHSISGTQLADLLTLISLHCLHGHPGLKSIHNFRKYFANLKTPIKKHYFCSFCLFPLPEMSTKTCPNESCKKDLTKKEKQYFIEIPLEQQLQTLFQNDTFLEGLKHKKKRLKTMKNNIEDIYDGNVYRALSGPEGPLSEKFPYNISFTWNTDGVPVFKSSKFSLWPMYLMINELPYKQRVKKENMLLCGLWFGENKPFMASFTRPLLKSLKVLEENGVNVNVKGQNVNCKGFLICGTADLPAKSLALNMVQFNGSYSCFKCTDKGETFKTQKGGSVHIFPLKTPQESYDSQRNDQQVIQDARAAITERKPVNGIKGPSFLMGLKSYSFVHSTSIDYMHCVLLGISKLLITLWFSATHASEGFSLIKFVDIVDERLLRIQPPNYITRIPRTVSNHFKYWKASELRSWLLFYSIPILRDILQASFLRHYSAFVEAIYLLNTDSISEDDLEKCGLLLNYFVYMFPVLYGTRYCTLNMHLLLHLPKCVQDLGPLWSYSCFPFEDANGLLMSLFHGTQHVELQIVSSVNILQRLPIMIQEMENVPLEISNFFKDMHKRSRLNKTKSKDDRTAATPLGKGVSKILPNDVYVKIVSILGFHPHKCFCYKRILLRGQVYHSKEYSRVTVRNSHSVKYIECNTNATRYGVILYFCLAKHCICEYESCQCKCSLFAAIQNYDIVQSTAMEENVQNVMKVTVPHIKVAQKLNENISVIPVQKILSLVVNISCSELETNIPHIFLCERVNCQEMD